MAETNAAIMTFTYSGTLTNSDSLSIATDVLSYAVRTALTTGTGINQSDRVWHSQRTLSATTSEVLDLVSSLTDAFGVSFAPARIKAIVVRNLSTTSGYNLIVGGAGTFAWEAWTSFSGSTVLIGPDGYMALVNPSATAYATTSGTGDLLKINNPNAASVTYDIIIVGASA